MAESTLNIDCKLTRNISNLQVNLPNISSFGLMRGEMQNVEAEENVFPDSFTAFNLGETNSNIPNDEEIPVVTIKNILEKESANGSNFENYEKYHESQRILPLLQVLDILASELITEKPRMYSFFGNNYKFTKVVGTIISKKIIKENKLNIGVDDGTGCISCIVETTDDDRQSRLNNDSLYEDICQHKVLNKDELNKFLDMDDAEFFNYINENIDIENAILTSTSKILLEKLKRNCYVFPFIEGIQIGTNVVLVGQVSDYMGQRLIFVKNLKVETNFCNYLQQMNETLKIKNEILECK